MRDKIDQRILLFIKETPCEPRHITEKGVAADVDRAPLTIKKRIEYLVGQGYISIDRESQMGRSLLNLTEKGCKILQERVAAQAEEA